VATSSGLMVASGIGAFPFRAKTAPFVRRLAVFFHRMRTKSRKSAGQACDDLLRTTPRSSPRPLSEMAIAAIA
jgi:hypothetical protein